MQRIIVYFMFMFMTAASGSFAVEGVLETAYQGKAPLPLKNTVAPPLLAEKNEYYEISGCSEHELHHDLKKKCIPGNNGKKFDSITTWDVKWDYDHESAPGTCAAESFMVTVDIIYRYPKWTRTGEVPQLLVEKWDRYLQNLILHEKGHRDMVAEAAAELTRAVADLPPAPTCSQLDRKVRALSRERMEKLKEDQNKYDADTKHGATQGAIFPCECSLAGRKSK
ncbi:MAG TPA: DUF922 domain-containing protein [Nitrospirota bacterium]|nr:DUF922 domain-containing protein [Nitrospirota bacterium]